MNLLVLITNSILLGAGLAMDAFSVSLVNGLNAPRMKKRRMILIAGVFGCFQTAMPLIGWVCVHTIVETFTSLQRYIPWIAFLLLGFIGGKMIWEGCRGKEEEKAASDLKLGALLVQGVATSIDALSVGFAMAEMNTGEAVTQSLIIGVVTFIICIAGILIGRKAGSRLSNKATIIGGIILIGIGIEILLTHLLA